MPTTATRKPTRRAANKTAMREAVAALNAGNHEDYLALFAPDATLHGFPAGIDEVDALSASTPRPPRASPTRPSRSTTPSPRPTASPRASRGARPRAPAGRSRPAAAPSSALRRPDHRVLEPAAEIHALAS